MNSKFKKRNFRSNRTDSQSGKPRELGVFLHMCEGLAVLRLKGEDIPYPNALVLDSEKKPIGKVEEVLGPQNEVYVAVKLDSSKDIYTESSLFYCHENKFIPKERFMERSEVEKKKEEGDKKKSSRGGGSRGEGKRGDHRKDSRGDYGRRDGDRRKDSRGGGDRKDNRRGDYGRRDGKRRDYGRDYKSKKFKR